MVNEVFTSSASNEWYTPQPLFETLDREFRFTLDPCATPESAKCSTFFTEQDDGLVQNWRDHRAFVNPPYGNVLRSWVIKGEQQGRTSLVVMLIPVRTDTSYWHEQVMNATEVRFIRGRINFNPLKGIGGRAPFPSAVVVFAPYRPVAPRFRAIDIEGNPL